MIIHTAYKPPPRQHEFTAKKGLWTKAWLCEYGFPSTSSNVVLSYYGYSANKIHLAMTHRQKWYGTFCGNFEADGQETLGFFVVRRWRATIKNIKQQWQDASFKSCQVSYFLRIKILSGIFFLEIPKSLILYFCSCFLTNESSLLRWLFWPLLLCISL